MIPRGLVLLILFCVASTVFGAEIETIVMPGEVIQGHAEYEQECKKCHTSFDQSGQKQLCLDCHEKVRHDVDNVLGFHGKNRNANTSECRSCHTDHKGRDANVVILNRGTFDHHATDFKLEGAHLSVACGSCHEPEKLYREAPGKCIDCHEKQDVHKGEMGKVCSDCHDSKSWTLAKYDHSKTKFPLKGAHKDALCESCHPNRKYKDIPKLCIACHVLDDAHGGEFGNECEKCHQETEWKKRDFDHTRDTKFPLRFTHAKVKCASCHKDPLFKKTLSTSCVDCHRKDDSHNRRFGSKCNNCHRDKSWSDIRFSHDKDTKFVLNGLHKKVDCLSCHPGELYGQELAQDCLTCHVNDDVHHGQQGKQCQRCHDEQGWGKNVVFSHGVTRFPLIGLHDAVPCEECHLQGTFKDSPTDCLSCHEGEDTHEGSLTGKCESCHNPNGWNFWRFDHDQQTDYKLEGKHKGLACNSCHTKPVEEKIEMATKCVSCHEQDDVHDNRFGRHCERCHITEDFSEIRM